MARIKTALRHNWLRSSLTPLAHLFDKKRIYARRPTVKEQIAAFGNPNEWSQSTWNYVSTLHKVPLPFLLRYRFSVNWTNVLRWLDYEVFLRYRLSIFLGYVVQSLSFWFWLIILVVISRSEGCSWWSICLFEGLIVVVHYVYFCTIPYFEYNPTVPLSCYQRWHFTGIVRYCLYDNPHIPFAECVKGYKFTEIEEFYQKDLLQKFLAEYSWTEIFTHPFFAGFSHAYPTAREVLYNSRLPLEFYERFFGHRDYTILFRVPTLTMSFWEEHWQYIPKYQLLDFLRDCPTLTVNFVLQHRAAIRECLPKGKEMRKQFMEALAQNRWTTQLNYQRYEHLFQRAKRNFLYRYYSPFTELGQKRLQQEYLQVP